MTDNPENAYDSAGFIETVRFSFPTCAWALVTGMIAKI
jgi:hypothetical protein